MDRRKIVYYNTTTQRRYRHGKRTAPSARLSLKRIVLAMAFIAVVGVITTKLPGNTSNENQKVLAEQATTSSVESERPMINSPLQNVELPTVGQTAIGTLEEGLIKKTANETQAPIASITKVITALVLLDKQPLKPGEKGDQIILTEKDLAYFNEYYAKLGTVTAVTVGQSMSYYEGLQAILLPSSNNMSDTLVDRYFESREAYLTYANDYLKKNGLNDTIVADASGFDPGSRSTPSDLIKLGQLALRHPVVAEIVAQKYATLAVAGDVPNYNQLIDEPDVIGIKPGMTDEAGYCLLFAHKIRDAGGKEHTVIAVTLGHMDRPAYLVLLNDLLNKMRTAYTLP